MQEATPSGRPTCRSAASAPQPTTRLVRTHTYTGQVDDGLGWMHYRARQYDPLLGRFMQADTIVADGLNGYTYVSNSPLIATDPSGQELRDAILGVAAHLIIEASSSPRIRRGTRM